MKKNIMMLVFSKKTGIGGHFYSLITIAEQLRKIYNVYIVNVGLVPSSIIENSPISSIYIYSDYRNVYQTLKNINKEVERYKIDILHAFDLYSYLLGAISAKKKSLPIVLNKCGGPNVKLPYVYNMIFFTKENYLFYRNSPKNRDCHFSLIPNRVSDFLCDEEKITMIRDKYNLKNKKVVLRVGSFSNAYKKTIEQAIELIDLLRQKNDEYILLLIGVIPNNDVYEWIKEKIKGKESYVFIETDKFFAENAKQILEIATVVVGTGRGFMEGCAKNKIMYAPCSNDKYPVLVTDENFEDVFATNFSDRYERKEHDVSLMEDGKQISRIWFEKRFSVLEVGQYYKTFYEELKCDKRIGIDIYYYLIKYYIASFMSK